MTDKNVSLTSWCNYHKVSKSTAYRRCQEMGISVANGLTDEHVRLLEREFNVQKNSGTPQPEAKPIAVDVGNHSMVLSDIGLPAQFSLEGLRSGEAIEILDPLAVAAKVLATADVLKTVMSEDIQNRLQKLNETRQARDAIADKTRELALEARLYQMETSKVDAELSQETQRLTEELGKLQQFARPAEPAQSSVSQSA